MTRIFISYSRRDADFARRIALELERRGAQVWLDTKNIEAGTKWSTAIQKALQEAEMMLVVVSPASMASVNVEDEWQYFLDQRKPIIPLLYKPAKKHFQLSRIQHIDFHQADYANALDNLLIELRNKGINLPNVPTSVPSPANPHLLRRSLLSEPWAIVLAAIITGVFAIIAAFISRPPPDNAATSTISVTTALALVATNTLSTEALDPPTFTPLLTLTLASSATHTSSPTTLPPTVTASAVRVIDTSPLPTASATPTPVYTSTPTTLPTIVPSSTPTLTLTASQTMESATCWATVKDDGKSSQYTNILRREPDAKSLTFGSLTPNQRVRVLEKKLQGARTWWYRIANEQHQELGWILDTYLVLPEACMP